MFRRFIVYYLVIALITASSIASGHYFNYFQRAVSVEIPQQQYTRTLVLLPLDSRPACTQLVEQLALLANIRVILPPAEYLDNYTQPANRQALSLWLREAAKSADALIISTDMLLSGSLLASRSNILTSANITAVADLLTTIRRENPHISMYSFHIIPRLLIADHTPDRQYQKFMQNYSILQDQVLQFENLLDIEKLETLEKTIPNHIIREYRLLYERNTEAHRTWISLVTGNVLDAVVIGQDDGYPFGLPNIVKQHLTAELTRTQHSDRIFITRGTDEVALTLLGRLALEKAPCLRVYVEYSSPDAPQVIMPFMPHSVATTVEEKLHLINAQEVANPEQADFRLFIHIGKKTSTPHFLRSAATRLKQQIESGQPVALVDLTEDYYASQTLLPYALEAEIGVERLAAYAGWNTTSNSIGTAVTQAALFTQRQPRDSASQLRRYYDNLTFLIARILDDWYYLKDVQPKINERLRMYGKDPYRLTTHHEKTEAMIRREMVERTNSLMERALKNKPLDVMGFEMPFYIQQVKNTINIPWDRTFEIKIQPDISLIQLLPNKK